MSIALLLGRIVEYSCSYREQRLTTTCRQDNDKRTNASYYSVERCLLLRRLVRDWRASWDTEHLPYSVLYPSFLLFLSIYIASVSSLAFV
jgi:hypothetical protein